MKFNKLAVSLALGLTMGVSMTAMADDPAPVESSQGKIQFTGFINDVPCSIDDDNLNQTVRFGEIALHELTSGKFRSDSRPFDIVLKNCSTETYKNAKITFTGGTISGFTGFTGELLGLGKVQNAGIVITDGGSKIVEFGKPFPGTGNGYDLNNGDGSETTLHFEAYVKGNEDPNNKATTGRFDTVANFKIIYQ
ncbi:fimbrial protein [Providencia vermicola]|uniref:Type 1 fimbrial protein n=2 Tax=Providencia TaxID=586 RepID=A0AAI9I2S2_PROST|nr:MULTISPECIES: fimbrial protein [Providencia]ELR5046194.1 type 1 fimbrial protein [Providencia rettgeri]ELR5037125.1 type 1 fimbrial protein [Providencia stuartii]ELR5122961.1 type 1 fimbrial protein [Providencia stuartii]ELR5144219.1 type 1 fimbrial protein [Providencia stuartii]ELR5293264.1 type 1 fimbrial protein [Providencia stuartii]